MAPPTLKKVRSIRSKGKKMLGGISDRLNILAWELASQNENIGDPNVTRAVNTMDEALENLQVAFALLNTIAVDPAMFEEKVVAKEEKAKPAAGKSPQAGFSSAKHRPRQTLRLPERITGAIPPEIFEAPQIGRCRILRLLWFYSDGRHITRLCDRLPGFGFTETSELRGFEKSGDLIGALDGFINMFRQHPGQAKTDMDSYGKAAFHAFVFIGKNGLERRDHITDDKLRSIMEKTGEPPLPAHIRIKAIEKPFDQHAMLGNAERPVT